jgi:hypothetical protein
MFLNTEAHNPGEQRRCLAAGAAVAGLSALTLENLPHGVDKAFLLPLLVTFLSTVQDGLVA